MHEICLVGWFVCDKWQNGQNRLATTTFADAKKELAALAVPYDGASNPERVQAFLLDAAIRLHQRDDGPLAPIFAYSFGSTPSSINFRSFGRMTNEQYGFLSLFKL